MVATEADNVRRSAVLDPFGIYRYSLSRYWSVRNPTKVMIICGANPSTADATVDDNTIRREMGFAKRDGYDGLMKVNVSAFRATDPKKCPPGEAGFGPDNRQTLMHVAAKGAVICAWGTVADPWSVCRALDIFREVGATLWCFGMTKDGHPKHPLYLPLDTPIVPFKAPS